MEFKKTCSNCRDCYCDKFGDKNSSARCSRCDDNFNLWTPPHWLEIWLNSFDTSSATECFTAVNLLKQRMEE